MNNNTVLIQTISIFFITIILIITSLIENNLAVSIIGIGYMPLGMVFLYFLNKRNFSTQIMLFLSFFTFYLIHMTIVHYGLIYLYDRVNIAPDELWFYTSSNQIIKYLENGYNLFDVANLFEYHELPAYIYLSGKLAILSNSIGENSVYIQKLLIVFFSSIIPVILYNIFITLNVNNKNAISATLIYGIFTYLTPVSTMILRDIPVALTFIIFFETILKNINSKNIFIIIVTCFISIYLRYETGLYLSLLTAIYLVYLLNTKVNNNLIKKSTYIFFIIIGLLIFLKSDLITTFLNIVYGYENLTAKEVTVSSLGNKLASLPYGLNYLGSFLFSQIQPFPFWINIMNFGILSFLTIFNGFIWMYVWVIIIYGIKNKILTSIDIRLKYLFFASTLYLVLLSSTGTITRRMMAVYPIIFVISTLSYMELNKYQKQMVFYITTSIYVFLTIAYLLIKGSQ